jgi:hypothetical protein
LSWATPKNNTPSGKTSNSLNKTHVWHRKNCFPSFYIKHFYSWQHECACLKCSNFGSWSLSTLNYYWWPQCMDLIYATPSTTSTSCMSHFTFATHLFNFILCPILCCTTRSHLQLLPLAFRYSRFYFHKNKSENDGYIMYPPSTLRITFLKIKFSFPLQNSHNLIYFLL